MRKDYTLLYTDVVDSTAVNTRLGDAGMATLWEEHDRRSRELLRQWHGIEIDRSDGFLVLFDDPADALAFIDAYHRLLKTLPVPLRARAGLHVGPLLKRENLPSEVLLGAKAVEVVGIAKAYAARLMALAQGGQTLASPSAHAALQEAGALSGRWRSVSHGHWRMKGMDGVVEVFEIGDAQSAFVPPADSDKSQRVVQIGDAWVGVREVPHNLPGERDSFVGRGGELKTLAQQFAEGARLITVTGPGGMGKTRLALRYAWSWLGDHPGGLWFCDLASARSIDGLLFAIGQGLDVPLGNDPLAQLGRAIAGRGDCLVILDNFEQVRRHARDTIGRWLDAAPQARFIVTSREVLGLAGERTLALAPLPAEDAAALFHQRARAASTAHDPDVDPEATRDLVELLDGMPLAIELAAPRVRVMTTADLLQGMGNRFRLLAAQGGRPDRQATLRATLAWSWELLRPEERTVLGQLSVFDGGFAWQAVQAVVKLGEDGAEAAEVDDAPWIIDLLQSLVDKSLVTPQLGARFNLLRSVQDFAAEELAREGSFPGSGPAFASAAQRRHFRYFAGFDEASALAARGADVDNLISACRHSVLQAAVADSVTCLRLAWAALQLTGPFHRIVELADELRQLQSLQPLQLATVAWVAGQAHGAVGENERAQSLAQSGLDCLAAGGPSGRAEEEMMARLHCVIGTALVSRGDFDSASHHLGEALRHLPRDCDANVHCTVLNGLGALAHHQGRPEQSRKHYQAALQVAFAADDARWQCALLGNLGILLHVSGQLDAARTSYEESLRFAQRGGDRRGESSTRCNLGQLHYDQGRIAEAEAELTRSLQTARRLGHARIAYTSTCNLGLVAQSKGDFTLAEKHFLEAIAAAGEAGDQPSVSEFSGYLASLRNTIV